MNLIEIINRIVMIPSVLEEIEDTSVYTLLQETGYFSVYDKIMEDNLAEFLLNDLNIIDSWLIWSEDKRSGDGWYFILNENKNYEVGELDSSGQRRQYLEFSDRRIACATFIKREIENIRLS